MATKNFIEELEWRGMVHTIMPGAKELLEAGTQNISLRPGQTSESFISGTGSDFRTNQ